MPSKKRSTQATPKVTRAMSSGRVGDPAPRASAPDATPEKVSHAVNALRAARAAPSASPEPASMTFLIEENNGGAFHWTIVADGDEVLARSPGFGSYEHAERAASLVHDGAFRAALPMTRAVPLPTRNAG
jgi:uncharacterized protein YegP (UPF0339 family)